MAEIDPEPEFVDPVEIGANLHEYKFNLLLSPSQWLTYTDEVELEWFPVKFDRDLREDIPKDDNGVYSFVVQPNIASHPANAYLFYIGKTEKQGFRKRFLQYFTERDTQSRKQQMRRTKVRRFLRAFRNHLWFYYAPIDDEDKIDEVEKHLIMALLPWANEDIYPAELRAAINAFED